MALEMMGGVPEILVEVPRMASQSPVAGLHPFVPEMGGILVLFPFVLPWVVVRSSVLAGPVLGDGGGSQ